jgi:hypothetical protein
MRFLISPELGRIATRQGLELAFVAWSILRDFGVANNLSGHYSKKDFKAILGQYGLTYNRRHMLRLMQAGRGIFWRSNEKKIYLVSFAKVAKHFEQYRKACDYSSQRLDLFVQIQCTKSIEAIRSELYFAWFSQFEEKTISRASLQDLFGLSPDQQRSYEAKLGSRILVKSNYAHIDQETYFDTNRQSLNPYGDTLPSYSFKINYNRETTFGTSEKVTAIQYQLPNTFLARPESGNEFIPVKDAPNRAKSAIAELFGQVTSSKPKQRIYWTKWHQFEVFGNEESYIRAYYQGKKRLWISGHYL